MKGSTKSSPVNEEVPPLLEGGGKVEVVIISFPLFLFEAIESLTMLDLLCIHG